MHVKFNEDHVILDPKTREVVSAFKEGQEIELSPDGAKYFIDLGVAVQIQPAAASAEVAPLDEAAPLSVLSDDRRKAPRL